MFIVNLLKSFGTSCSGQTNGTVKKINPSFLRIQVTNLENKVSRSQLISQGVENEILLKKLWEPTIINAHIDSLGVIGTPIIISSSGSDEVDAVLLKVTKEQFEKVDFIPGFYEMKISI